MPDNIASVDHFPGLLKHFELLKRTFYITQPPAMARRPISQPSPN